MVIKLCSIGEMTFRGHPRSLETMWSHGEHVSAITV